MNGAVVSRSLQHKHEPLSRHERPFTWSTFTCGLATERWLPSSSAWILAPETARPRLHRLPLHQRITVSLFARKTRSHLMNAPAVPLTCSIGNHRSLSLVTCLCTVCQNPFHLINSILLDLVCLQTHCLLPRHSHRRTVPVPPAELLRSGLPCDQVNENDSRRHDVLLRVKCHCCPSAWTGLFAAQAIHVVFDKSAVNMTNVSPLPVLVL